MGMLLQDLRYGLRMLEKTPGFTALVMVTLAFGIFANAVRFSVVDAVVPRLLPCGVPAQLVTVYETERDRAAVSGFASYPNFPGRLVYS